MSLVKIIESHTQAISSDHWIVNCCARQKRTYEKRKHKNIFYSNKLTPPPSHSVNHICIHFELHCLPIVLAELLDNAHRGRKRDLTIWTVCLCHVQLRHYCSYKRELLFPSSNTAQTRWWNEIKEKLHLVRRNRNGINWQFNRNIYTDNRNGCPVANHLFPPFTECNEIQRNIKQCSNTSMRSDDRENWRWSVDLGHTGICSNTAHVITITSQSHVSILTPFRTPTILDYPIVHSSGRSVTNDQYSMIQLTGRTRTTLVDSTTMCRTDRV